MRIVSWNVNGLRAVDRTGAFRRWMSRSQSDIIGVQEVRARPEQLPRRLVSPRGWFAQVVAAERRGYSGVGLFARRSPDLVDISLGIAEFDREGRVQLARFGRLVVANVYFPNGNGRDRDLSRVPFKLRFYRAMRRRLQCLRDRGDRVVVIGDFNTAHSELDLARPGQNRNNSGFLPAERAALDSWLNSGWTDTFRAFESGGGHYTWWSQRKGVRERNVGWRIDYVLACEVAMPFVRAAFIWPRVRGSDHCPIGIDVDPAICE